MLEKDPLIRALLERWLAEAGYDVVEHLPGCGEKPALVIADLRDPHDADVLLLPLREYAAPILVPSARFMRGLAGSAQAARGLGVKRVLPKPFTRKELLLAVRDSIEGDP